MFGDVSMDPPALNLGTVQFSRQVHVLVFLVPKVEPHTSCIGRWVIPVSRSGSLRLQRNETRFSGGTLRSLFVVPPTLTRLQRGNYFATICAKSSIANTCTKTKIHRIFKI